ncbi:MAG TPA: hypothetical protein VHW60_23645 [Caulobacteraceae bacterium]|jgi:hypothetical protein|nr:hypothetical protein [Caulobacteraceae bacterium]
MAHHAAMNAILYPVAANAEEALARPKGRAAREREAKRLAGGPVRFVTEATGPGFATREAALDAYGGRVDDERPSRRVQVAPEDRYCAVAERIEDAPAPGPVEPAFARGRRWPAPPARRAATVFRMMVSYWRWGEAVAEPTGEQARRLRRKTEAAQMDAAQLRALAGQPMRPFKPQQPLDIGLFEMPAPEAPHILIPDE